MNIIKTIATLLVSISTFISLTLAAQNSNAINKRLNGPLKISAKNTNYFTDNSGRAIFLTGSHTWANFQEHYDEKVTTAFDWKGYLDMMQVNNHNFIRLWMFEHPLGQAWTQSKATVEPMMYQRTGKDTAYDGKPKFDVTKFNQPYFDRLRKRVIDAGNRGIYVAVMLFNGWSQNKLGDPKADPFLSHPFNKTNNINGIAVPNTTSDTDGEKSLHSLENKAALALQEEYIKKVIETVNDLDNVLYEIINEGGTTSWQYHMVNLIHDLEKRKPRQHMVGLGNRMYPLQSNSELWNSPADYISPTWQPIGWSAPGSTYVEDYANDPPRNNKNKVCIIDTDHMWGHGGNYIWAWKSFCRGLNPIFMDPWQPLSGYITPKNADWLFITGGIPKNVRDYPDFEPLRKNMGYIKKYADKMDLKNMLPHDELSTARYCLANPGKEYLFYLPTGGKATIDLSHDSTALYEAEWFIPILNQTLNGSELIKGGYYTVVESPFVGDAVLYLKRK